MEWFTYETENLQWGLVNNPTHRSKTHIGWTINIINQKEILQSLCLKSFDNEGDYYGSECVVTEDDNICCLCLKAYKKIMNIESKKKKRKKEKKIQYVFDRYDEPFIEDQPGLVPMDTSAEEKMFDFDKPKDNKVKRRTKLTKKKRHSLWRYWHGPDVDRALCYCCGETEVRIYEYIVGHVVAFRNGGELRNENLRCICSACNGSMGTTNLEEYKRINFPHVPPFTPYE